MKAFIFSFVALTISFSAQAKSVNYRCTGFKMGKTGLDVIAVGDVSLALNTSVSLTGAGWDSIPGTKVLSVKKKADATVIVLETNGTTDPKIAVANVGASLLGLAGHRRHIIQCLPN